MEQAQRQSLEKALRRLHAGLKTFQLYSSTHASAQATVTDVTATLRGYLQRYGAIGVQVNKDKLLADGTTLTEGSMDSLAYFFYVRNLASVAVLPGGGPAHADAKIDVAHLLMTLETLDRAIVDEPHEDQEALLQNLAQGVLQLDEPVRAALAPELVSQVVEGGSGRAILSELTGQQIALLVLGPVAQSDVAAGLGRFLGDLRVSEEKAAEVAALLQTAIAAGGEKAGSRSPWLGQAEDGQSNRDTWEGIDLALLTMGRSEERRVGKEGRSRW